LLQLLDDKSEEIISFSVEALSKIGGDAVKDKLVAELENNPNPEKEFYIYTALAQLGVEDAFLPVVDGLDKENENVMVRTVMKAIERIGKPIVPFLVEQLTRKEWHVRNRVQISLTKMGHDILDDLKEIRDANDDKDVKFWLNKIIREIEKKDEILRK
ncbi:HEAT repeat domain-containing protein, partial [bacterium]|nr:HEAT repeat domain-containing protein [bacterium]